MKYFKEPFFELTYSVLKIFTIFYKKILYNFYTKNHRIQTSRVTYVRQLLNDLSDVSVIRKDVM